MKYGSYSSSTVSPCPNCGGTSLFRKDGITAGGSHGPNLLPHLGKAWGMVYAKFDVVVCGDCGLLRLFADEEARAKLPETEKWQRL